MKKFILLMLTAALVALPVLSCAADDEDTGRQPGDDPWILPEDGNGPVETAAPGEEYEYVLTFPDLPDVNFGGYEFRILNVAQANIPWLMTTILVEEETGEALNDAIFRRNRRMEERFGFELAERTFTGPGQVRDSARRSVQAGSDDFDLAMLNSDHALAMAQDGLLEMIDRIPYVDLSRPWWDQDMNRDFSIGHRLFFTSGDFSFNQYSATIPIFFNKLLHSDLGLECPYALVREGRWTIDRFGEQARHGVRDLNADGVLDRHDQWGFMAFSQNYTAPFLNGAGTRFIIKDADDFPVLNINSEGFIFRFLAIFDVLQGGEWLFDGNLHGVLRPEDMFLNNQALFWSPQMNWAPILRGMDADFGILPIPKLNEQQEYHISGTGPPHVMSIPVTTDDLERTGIILEALNAESRLTTLHVYLDTMLVNQVLNRDEDSGEMLDIIFANRVYETGRFFWNSTVHEPFNQAMAQQNRDIASIIEAREAAANAAIEAAIAAFVDN